MYGFRHRTEGKVYVDRLTISEFRASLATGYAPHPVTVEWRIDRPKEDWVVPGTLDLGDGTVISIENCLETTSYQYTYTKVGSYVVKLTASDEGGEATATDDVRALFPALTITSFTASPRSALALPSSTTLGWHIENPSTNRATCTLEFGDEAPPFVSNDRDDHSLGHTYPKLGIYVVTLTADNGYDRKTDTLVLEYGFYLLDAAGLRFDGLTLTPTSTGTCDVRDGVITGTAEVDNGTTRSASARFDFKVDRPPELNIMGMTVTIRSVEGSNLDDSKKYTEAGVRLFGVLTGGRKVQSGQSLIQHMAGNIHLPHFSIIAATNNIAGNAFSITVGADYYEPRYYYRFVADSVMWLVKGVRA